MLTISVIAVIHTLYVSYDLVCTYTRTHTYTHTQSDLYQRTQLVTEEEREHVMSGNFDNLLAEQERRDRERDNEVSVTFSPHM